jgi:hypothetical protein
MIDSKVLLKALQKQVSLLEKDLTPTGLADARLKVEWRAAKSHDRTAATFETWLGERVTQVAVAWVLGTIFLRFCEDNGLIEYPFITGPGDRADLARDLQAEYFQKHPEQTDRDWIIAGLDAMSVSPVAQGLFDRRHNPMWTIQPSHDAAKVLLAFWRETGPDGQVVYELTDPERNTRFLGDLYQDLSEAVRKTYALLQTPEFVEEFILKYTLEPAIEEFGLTPAPPTGHEDLPHRLRVIDPACGSGHFLLGAFRKLLAAWEAEKPGADKWELIREALSSVHGVDKNPFAVATARFRLMLAAMRAGGVERLSDQVDFPLNIAIGDSLLHGKGAPGRQVEFDYGGEIGTHSYRTEDVDEFTKSVHILEIGTYHVVVGNPPYITPKDKAENENYRKAYPSCHMQYALSVPFAERIFQLGIRDFGYTGQITANSFMKREFGKKLIEEFFAHRVELTHIIDTSGAYIPGHGTPTVILFGRRRQARPDSTIRAVLGVRGEPEQPIDPAKGLVWQAIAGQVERPGTDSEWVSVGDFNRSRFTSYPWSLAGGGAGDVFEAIEESSSRLAAVAESIGFMAVTREDDAYFVDPATARRIGLGEQEFYPVSGGASLRDWSIAPEEVAIFPYLPDGSNACTSARMLKHFWLYRIHLGNRKALSGTQEDRGLPWYTYSDFHADRWAATYRIGFAFVATANQFVSIGRRNLLIRTAPVIKLPEEATEDDHLALLGVLNSSTSCFWLHQVSHNKGEGGGARVEAGYSAMGSEAWKNTYEFTSTKLEQFPLPADMQLEFGRDLDTLAHRQAAVEPTAICLSGVPTRQRLDAARDEHSRIRRQMIAAQEELDWDVYRRYCLITAEEAADLGTEPGLVPELNLGERAFEIVLARCVQKGELHTEWFSRFGGRQTIEIPAHWPEPYREVVARRIEVIERDRNIGLIERPECKRRWQSEPWEDKERAALKTWLLDRCEERSLWFSTDGEPVPMTVNRLADRLRKDADVVSVARLLRGLDADLGDVLREIIAEEHVPVLAQYRYKPSGLDKRSQWERTWHLQREEDATGTKLDIDVPPKYAGVDFQRQSYWRHRGKLDVPKERFISYPDASPDSDPKSLLVGWAGWDHREQAAALITLIQERSDVDGWETPKLMGLLAGLLEVMPWVRQWHGEVNPDFGMSYADAYDGYLTSQRESRSLTEDNLRTWTPTPSARGGRKRKA